MFYIHIYIPFIARTIANEHIANVEQYEQNSPHTTVSIFMSNRRDMWKKMLHGNMQQTQTKKTYTETVP